MTVGLWEWDGIMYAVAVGHCYQRCHERRSPFSDGGAIPRMEHAKRRSASTSLFLHRGKALNT